MSDTEDTKPGEPPAPSDIRPISILDEMKRSYLDYAMFRIFAVLAALICVAPAFAQPLPAGLDKQNAIVIDTTKGRIVIQLRPDIAPQHDICLLFQLAQPVLGP